MLRSQVCLINLLFIKQSTEQARDRVQSGRALASSPLQALYQSRRLGSGSLRKINAMILGAITVIRPLRVSSGKKEKKRGEKGATKLRLPFAREGLRSSLFRARSARASESFRFTVPGAVFSIFLTRPYALFDSGGASGGDKSWVIRPADASVTNKCGVKPTPCGITAYPPVTKHEVSYY